MKHAILVVGTGRSGTSAMAGALKILGAYLGESLKPADPANTRGYFENTRITDLNKAALAEAGMSWYVSPPESMRAVPASEALRAAVADRVAEVFADRSPILIKDPRLCVLIDVYAAVLRGAGYDLHAVRMLRDPGEVARSIAAWGPGTEAMVRRNAALLDEALGHASVDCVDCSFDDLIAHTRETILRVAARLPFLPCTDERIREVLRFVDGSLRRHGPA